MSLLLDALKQAEENKKKSAVKVEPSVPLESNSSLELEADELTLKPTPEMSLLEEGAEECTHHEVSAVKSSAAVTEPMPKPAIVEPFVRSNKTAQVDVLGVGKKKEKPNYYKKVLIGFLLLLITGVSSLFLLEPPPATDSSYKDILAAQKKKQAKLVPLVVTEPVAEPAVDEPQIVDKIIAKADTVELQEPPEPSRDDAAIKISKKTTSSATLSKLERAYQALLGHELERAGHLYQQVLAAQPKQIDALLGLANIASQHKNQQQARRLYEKVLRLDATNNTAQIGLLQTYEAQDVMSQQQVLEELITKQPDNPEAYLGLGHALSEQGRWKAAQEAYFKAFSLNPKNTVYAYNLGVSLDSLGQYQAAKTFYQKALSLNQLAAKPLNLERVSNRLMELSNADD